MLSTIRETSLDWREIQPTLPSMIIGRNMVHDHVREPRPCISELSESHPTAPSMCPSAPGKHRYCTLHGASIYPCRNKRSDINDGVTVVVSCITLLENRAKKLGMRKLGMLTWPRCLRHAMVLGSRDRYIQAPCMLAARRAMSSSHQSR